MNIQDIPDSALEECYCIIDGESRIYTDTIYPKDQLKIAKQQLELLKKEPCPSRRYVPPFRLMKMSIAE